MSGDDSGRTVSVIIPARNAEGYILDALRSVRAQEYAPLEILLVDDGSTDGTAALVEREMPEVKIVRQANTGVAGARNTGLKHAAGDFICFLDADDGWFPGKLAAQLSYLEQHPDVGAVSHAWLDWRPDPHGNYPPLAWQAPAAPPRADPAQSGWIYPRLLLEPVVQTSTMMMRREIVEMTGFFRTDLTTGEDYDYWLRLSRLSRIDKLSAPYSFYRRGSPESLTGRILPVNHGYEVIRAAIGRWGLAAPDGAALPRKLIEHRLGELAFDFAYGHFHRGSAKLARQASWLAFRHDPRRWRALAYILLSLFRVGGRKTGGAES
ncbi:MAG: glycosyltransferase family 2 protein [Azoarcus sp.]|nr:glycosyltransferase family 2 protein [Azoarcus sp.]